MKAKAALAQNNMLVNLSSVKLTVNLTLSLKRKEKKHNQ